MPYRSASPRSQLGASFVLGLMFAGFAVWLGWSGAWALMQGAALTRDGVATTGQIELLDVHATRGAVDYRVTYRYAGQEVHARELVPATLWSQLHQGDFIPVTYLKETPAVSRIALPAVVAFEDRRARYFMGGGVLMLVFGGAAIYRSEKWRRRLIARTA